ncbi:hypothetical protein VIF_001178 [Vibrio cholerae TM 11079-80]|nr:hypothetical protein VIF_001178 [Vibrio cholerae TM 11079-80]
MTTGAGALTCGASPQPANNKAEAITALSKERE